MSELFFESLTPKQWKAIKGYLLHCLLLNLTDSETREAVHELVHLIAQFCPDEEV